jgi:hypothetical protein
MQGHLKINIDLFSALCPPQLHKDRNDAHIRSGISMPFISLVQHNPGNGKSDL